MKTHRICTCMRSRADTTDRLSSGIVDLSACWLPVLDSTCYDIAWVIERFDGGVELQRANPPPDEEAILTVTEEAFAELSPVTSDPNIDVADLVDLPDVNTAALLHNLKLRYGKDDIFTAIGESCLVTVNPYKPLDACQSEHLSALAAEADPSALPPHIFKIAHASYTRMLQQQAAQSILISGESGAGKTEATKQCMNCLAELSGSSGSATEAALESGVLLEAFGNARTAHNDNSSRFGKWCEVHFDATGQIGTCRILQYLLEKSRVVSQNEGERNYHFFYQLIAAAAASASAATDSGGALLSAPEARELKLLCGRYAYLGGQGAAASVPSHSSDGDAEAFRQTTEKLFAVGFDEGRRHAILRLCSAVLMLGNIAFTDPAGATDPTEGEDGASPSGRRVGGGDRLQIADPAPLLATSSLLGVEPAGLAAALTARRVQSGGRGSAYTVPLSEQQCLDSRDSLAKNLYAALFAWLVAQINEGMERDPASSGEVASRFIGILDVFGFENFEFNSFEQLCINYTNEKLQQQFLTSLVKRQQEGYAQEGLEETPIIAYPDNLEQLNLLDGRMVTHSPSATPTPLTNCIPLTPFACDQRRASCRFWTRSVLSPTAQRRRMWRRCTLGRTLCRVPTLRSQVAPRAGVPA